MKARALLTFLAAALLGASVSPELSAQSKPQLSGGWTLDPGAARANQALSGLPGTVVMGPEVKITQESNTIRIERSQGKDLQTFLINLDGSETKATVRERGRQTEQSSRAIWDGTKLTITTVSGFVITRQALWVECGNLVVETTGTGHGGEKTTTKAVYLPHSR